MTEWLCKGVCVMNIKVNGFRAGVMATLLAIGGASCKRVPYKPMPAERISPKMEQVVDSFCKKGIELKENPDYKRIHNDTIRFRDAYVNHPRKLARKLEMLANYDKYPSDEGDISFLYYNDPVYVVDSKEIFMDEKCRAHIAVTEYDKK